MDATMLQTLIVGLIVALAALSVGRRGYRLITSVRRKNQDGCGGGCGCGPHH